MEWLMAVLMGGLAGAIVSGAVSLYTSKRGREHLENRLQQIDLPRPHTLADKCTPPASTPWV